MKEPKLEINTRVITFDNRRIGRNLEAIYSEGTIIKVYTLVFHPINHLYQYRYKNFLTDTKNN